MSATLLRPGMVPGDESVRLPRSSIIDAGIATSVLVVAMGLALLLGAPLGVPEAAAAAAAIVAGLVVGRVGGSPVLLGAWLLASAAGVGLLGMHRESASLAMVVGAAVMILSAAVQSRHGHALVAATLLLMQLLAWPVSGSEQALTALAVTAVTALGGGFMVSQVERRMALSTAQIEALTEERSTVAKLYEVASSIGASTTRAEALPDLLGAVAVGVGARSCAVALFEEMGSRLVLVGPVWVNGAHIPVDDDVVARVARGGFGERALRATRAIRFERSGAPDLEPILRDLGLDSGLVASLRLEGRERGLLIVGDPVLDRFSDADVSELTALATAVSLVLAQVGQHEAVAEVARRLKEVADMKSDFVSMVSHELRTPLTSVMGALDTLSRPDLSPDSPAVAELVDTARRQASRLRRLIDDLLVLSRIDRGLVRPTPAAVEVRSAVIEAVGLVPGVEVSVDVPALLEVEADPHQLGQVLTNLLENARKYGDGSSVDVSGESTGNGEITIAVSDHGPGIPASEQSRVFERFVRLDPGGPAGGTGLGLAIVQMLVEGMGGRVEVMDTPGGGATFVVVLPEAA